MRKRNIYIYINGFDYDDSGICPRLLAKNILRLELIISDFKTI